MGIEGEGKQPALLLSRSPQVYACLKDLVRQLSWQAWEKDGER